MAKGSFRSDHHFVAGLILTAGGLLGIAGSLTGNLAAMLAGLFCNNGGMNTALYTVPTSQGGAANTPSGQNTPGGG